MQLREHAGGCVGVDATIILTEISTVGVALAATKQISAGCTVPMAAATNALTIGTAVCLVYSVQATVHSNGRRDSCLTYLISQLISYSTAAVQYCCCTVFYIKTTTDF